MRRFLGLLSFLVAAAWDFKWEVVRAFLYDRGFHFMGLMEADTWVHWGPTLALVGCGLYLFWQTGKHKAATPEVNAPVIREAHAPAVKNPVRDVAVSEAIAYLVVQEWEKSFLDVAKDINAAKLYDDFLQAAADGTVPVWGKKTNHGVYEPIPREFWYENRIEWFGLLKKSAHTESSKHSFKGDSYQALMTSRAAVESLVPEEIEGASYPNVRAADNPSIHDEILSGRNRDKFLAFLSSGEIDAWARPMFGTSDYVKIPSNAWDTHRIDVQLHSGDSVGPDGVHQVHHQSYLRRKAGTKEATHYDVAFNRAQLKKIWPLLSFKLNDGSGR